MKQLLWLPIIIISGIATYLLSNTELDTPTKAQSDPQTTPVTTETWHSTSTADVTPHQSKSESDRRLISAEVESKDDFSSCHVQCLSGLLDELGSGQPLSAADYRKLTGDMPALVTFLSDNPDVVETLAMQSSQHAIEQGDGEGSQPILHILRQLPYATLAYIASDLTFSIDEIQRQSGLSLISLAYKANVSDDQYADKADLRNALESFIYIESDLSNKLQAFEILANHEWQDTNINHLKTLEGVFNQAEDTKLQGKALETIAVFGGQVSGFEDTLVEALSGDSPELKISALSALNKLAVFIDKNDPAQTTLLARLADPLKELISTEPADSYYAYRANKLLAQHFSQD